MPLEIYGVLISGFYRVRQISVFNRTVITKAKSWLSIICGHCPAGCSSNDLIKKDVFATTKVINRRQRRCLNRETTVFEPVELIAQCGEFLFCFVRAVYGQRVFPAPPLPRFMIRLGWH